MHSTTPEEESKFLTSVAVPSLTQLAVVDYSEEAQATNRSSSYPTAAMLQPAAAMVAMVAIAAIRLSLQEDTVNLVRVKAPWEVEA